MLDAAARWSLVVAVALLVAAGAATSPRPPAVAAVAAAAALVLVLVFRQATDWVLVAGALAAGTAVTVLASGSAANLGWFAVCVLVGWAAFRAETLPAVLLGLVAVVGFLVQWIRPGGDVGYGTWVAGTVFTLAACLMARRQRDLAERLQQAQAGLAERAATEERGRIARELHDVIGHALTVSLLHVTSARLALREDPDEAEQALAEAERLGRASLVEVRHAVGLLREGASDGRTPLPDGAAIGELVAGFRRSGAALDWEVGGDPASLPSTVGLTVYRILQEALTNAARHSPDARTSARLVVAPGSTELVVHSVTPDVPPGPAAPGAGVVGMRERAESVGGTLTAGPAAGGWRVRAVLPS